MSSIPGIDSRAPERTETSSGSSGSPERLAGVLLSRPSASSTSPSIPSGTDWPPSMYATHASVVIVNPAGTRSAPRMRVISATFAPLPPSRSRCSREPSAKSYTHFVSRAIPMARDPTRGGRAQPVVARGARRSRRWRARPGAARARRPTAHRPAGRPTAAEELVRLVVQREAARLAGGADHAARRRPRTRRGDRPRRSVAQPAELRNDPGGEQQLQAGRRAGSAWVAWDAPPAAGVEQRSWLQSRSKTAGLGSEVSNSRATASQARAALSSAAPSRAASCGR